MIFTILSFLAWSGISPIPYLSNFIGATEAALSLLISILLSYPLALIYHKYVRVQEKYIRHLYFLATGLEMAFFNFGLTLYHNMIPVLVMYLTNQCIKPGEIHALFTFVFNIGYLLIGYIMTESEEYDITWTMPHCVLTLKLIALSFDLWDGQKLNDGKQAELSQNNKKTAISTPPTVLELLGFIYFPASFLVGPLFSFKRYSEYINDKYPLEDTGTYSKHSFDRLIQGMLYLAAFQIGVTVFDVKFMLTDEFWEKSILYRHFYCGFWAHFALFKYISCWLLTEASCIRFGLSYNGKKYAGEGDDAVNQWDGCNNIKLLRFETATKFQHYIDSFNCNTNYFAAEYIYKRLKFLGNRNLSQLLTLAFLALWHGIRSGYYATFFNEFLIILMEKDLESILSRTKWYQAMWENTAIKSLLYLLLKVYTIVFMGWSLVPFDLKIFSKWWMVYYSLGFSGYLLFLPWTFLYKPLVLKLLKPHFKTH